MVVGSSIETLQASLRGELIQPNDPGYEQARAIYNADVDKRPRFIVRPVNAADVMRSVAFARENDLEVAVRCGGHNPNGFAMSEGGMTIDLSRMKGIRLDTKNQTVRVEGGCTWGDVDNATNEFGYAVPGGVISTTGVAGLSLGGGIGYLTRKGGLSCDNILSADVVTADGNLVVASANENDDLYWALRGGGGNFGVVTSFDFRMLPVSTVFAGPILWPLDRAKAAMQNWRDFMRDAPDDVNSFFAFLVVPPGDPFPSELHNKTVCGVVTCFTGALEDGEAALKPLLEFGPPAFQLVGPMPHPVLNSMFDPLLPPGMHHYWKADFVTDVTDEIIDAHIRHGPDIPNIHSAMHIYPVSGAAGRPGKNDTAWSYRDARYSHVIAAVFPDASDTAKMRDWVRKYYEALHPYSAGGAYVNFMHEEGQDRVRDSYRDNWDRLAGIKAKYDPTNFFRLNQNITPA